MFCNFFELIKGSRWSKASKCKSLIRLLRKRLMIQKNRRNAIRKQTRDDIAQLLKHGEHKVALKRVPQLYKDECTLSAYDQIENFCDLIYIDCHNISSDLSTDMLEAVSSLVFAASRCGELPELHSLRKLFTRQFGRRFEKENVELLPGNAVNSRIKQSLTAKSISVDMRNQLFDEIATESIQSREEPLKDQFLVPEVDTPKRCTPKIVNITGSKVHCTNLNHEYMVQKKSHEDNNGTTNDGISSVLWVDRVSYNNNMTKKTTNQIFNDVKHSTSEQSIEGRKVMNRSQTSHIHPKLPDYDDLVSEFKDRKREIIQQSGRYKVLHRWMRW